MKLKYSAPRAATAKVYLSREDSRAWESLGMPKGDATGGAAYGQANDPISAIISVASMAGTYAAAGSFAAMTLAQGLVFAGGALSLVGNVTGNKTLSKLGLVTGLAGGLGSVFAPETFGSLTAGPAADAAKAGPGLTPSTTNSLSQSVAPGGVNPVVDGVPTSGPMDTSSLVNNAPVTVDPSAASQTLAQNVNTPGSGLNPLNAPGGGVNPVNTPSGGYDLLGTGPSFTQTGIPNQYSLPTTSLTGQGLSMATGANNAGLSISQAAGNSLYSGAQPGLMDTLSKFGKGAMDLAKSNPGAAMMMGQMATGVADWLSGKSDAEIAALEAQTGYADARAQQIQEEIAKEKRRRQQVNQNLMRIGGTGISVNPNAQIPAPWAPAAPPPLQGGLINTARTGNGG